MEQLAIFFFFLVILVIANLGVTRRPFALLTAGLLILTNIALLLYGAAFVLQSAVDVPPDAAAAPVLFTPQAGLILALTGVLGFAPLVPAVRRMIADTLPLDADNSIHTTALVFAIYLVGGTVAQFAIDIASLVAQTESQLTVADLWVQGAFFAAFGVVGVGIFVRRSIGETLRRLGIGMPTARQIGFALLAVIGFLILDFIVSVVWFAIDPQSYNELADLTGELFENLMTPVGALSIGLTAGIGEEILFRGALQPRFGLIVTSILFALGHTQYALSPALVEVFIIGLVLGIIRQRENTTTTILIHVLYNTLNVLLAPFWPG